MTIAALSARALGTMLADWRDTGPAYVALAERICLLIVDGRIASETRLPAERELSETLQLSRTTVSSAYRTLRERGFLRSTQGSGSVSQIPAGQEARGATPRGLEAAPYDLTTACPPPWPGLRQLTERTLAEHPELFTEHGYDLLGTPELRAAIARRYTERGLPTEPENIMVTVGAQHAIGLLSRTLLRRGDRALIENPSYPHARDALIAAGARLTPLPVSTDDPTIGGEAGWDADQAVALFRRASPALAYLIPDIHNPTGLSMPQETRERIIRAAEHEGTTLIVDETTAELSHTAGPSPLPFAASAPPGRAGHIITLGSMGKTVWGGLRVGWIRATPHRIRRLVAARPAHDLGTPTIDQWVAMTALDSITDILLYRSEQLAATNVAMRAALAHHLPEWTLSPGRGGVCLWANLGAPLSTALTIAASSHGLLLTAGPRFGLDGAFERFLRVPLSMEPQEVEPLIVALAGAWHAVSGGRRAAEDPRGFPRIDVV
ncbi:PLP-dependent aminotransferase family protein [Klugiella xanthotipulae]|uniref:GntR family transcriptional regulator n=1 Tax=Klugiella xanthotipulae TaxID=244735 RepID=A0A543I436_9MICO|nr:PLP-dependent aminotransferase family protein [Klugiella xanthotipulae]TQM65348.1 GntR family transcriptional regulator [Klugiella xanthotipulae]